MSELVSRLREYASDWRIRAASVEVLEEAISVLEGGDGNLTITPHMRSVAGDLGDGFELSADQVLMLWEPLYRAAMENKK